MCKDYLSNNLIFLRDKVMSYMRLFLIYDELIFTIFN